MVGAEHHFPEPGHGLGGGLVAFADAFAVFGSHGPSHEFFGSSLIFLFAVDGEAFAIEPQALRAVVAPTQIDEIVAEVAEELPAFDSGSGGDFAGGEGVAGGDPMGE
jgi:hypothetical protein